jgi:hypothetical protein
VLTTAAQHALPTLSEPERGSAKPVPPLCKQGVRGSSPLGSTPSSRAKADALETSPWMLGLGASMAPKPIWSEVSSETTGSCGMSWREGELNRRIMAVITFLEATDSAH